MDFSTVRSSSLSREEQWNVATHALGVLFCLIAIPLLLWRGVYSAGFWQLAGVGAFCASLLLVYLTSTFYHGVVAQGWKQRLRRLDHICIYFLIAGTHTPFLVYFQEAVNGYFFLALLWGMVALGVVYKLFFFGKLELLSVVYYLAMGWMAVFTLPAILHQISDATLFWIVAGGLSYTLGVVFFLWERLRYHHAIWHLFVLGGSVAHFFAVWEVVR